MENTPSALSRRGLLKGAAAGLLSYPWVGTRALAETPSAYAQRNGGLVNESPSDGGGVTGTWHPKFRRVRDEFVKNFQERGELGASVCLVVEGKTVVDLWGGIARKETGAPWQEDTLVQVWSSTKGATALCAHILASRGLLDLDAPVVQYWPEFGQNGKAGITVAMLLSHQAGLPAVRARLRPGAFYDWDYMVATLAAETPFWEPGTRNGYHALTFGFLVGEIVRRVSGRSLGTFFREEVATPLGLDFWIGLPASEDARVAPTINPPDQFGEEALLSPFWATALSEAGSIPNLVFFNTGGYTSMPGESDSREAHAAEIGSVGAITNARGLAGMYAALVGGGRSPVTLVDANTLARMGRVASSTGQDVTGLIPTRFALGYVKSMDNRRQAPGMQDSVILSDAAFGHSGFGGSIGFADPEAHLSFGYTMNQMGLGTALNPRGQSLIDATYQSLGYPSNASGTWVPPPVKRRRRRR